MTEEKSKHILSAFSRYGSSYISCGPPFQQQYFCQRVTLCQLRGVLQSYAKNASQFLPSFVSARRVILSPLLSLVKRKNKSDIFLASIGVLKTTCNLEKSPPLLSNWQQAGWLKGDSGVSRSCRQYWRTNQCWGNACLCFLQPCSKRTGIKGQKK